MNKIEPNWLTQFTRSRYWLWYEVLCSFLPLVMAGIVIAFAFKVYQRERSYDNCVRTCNEPANFK